VCTHYRIAVASALFVAVQQAHVIGCAAADFWGQWGSIMSGDSSPQELTHCWSQDIQLTAGSAPCGHHRNATLAKGHSAKVRSGDFWMIESISA
jgi:hypothetical protein